MKQQREITLAFMATLPVISLVFLKVRTRSGYLIRNLHSALHSPPTFSFCWSRTFVDFSSPSMLVYNLFHNSSLFCVYAMPRERIKPKCGPTYYSLVAWHQRAGPPSAPSLSPNPFNNPIDPPYFDKNWHDDAQLTPGNMEPMPQIPDPVLNYGVCRVEEEIPPNWMEDTKENIEPSGIAFPMVHPNIDIGGCVVE